MIKEAIENATRPLQERIAVFENERQIWQKIFNNTIAPLRERMSRLEDDHVTMKYCGVYESETQYERGNFVTHQGAIWHANGKTSQRPGNGTQDWVLAVKSGQSR
jgi:hypothetical protein